MSTTVDKQNGKWSVTNSDGSTAGSFDSGTDAIKQQRALDANEARVAAMYAELDAQPEEDWLAEIEPIQPVEGKVVPEYGQDRALTALLAAVLARMDDLVQRLEVTEQSNRALVGALQTLGSPVVHVAPPEITVQAPEVTFKPEIVMPQAAPVTKTITFERDPLTGQVSSADVKEGGDGVPVV